MMAGFGGTGRAKNPKETPKSTTTGEALARAMQKEYNKLRREEGTTVSQVFAREKGKEEWYPVGNVRSQPTNPCSRNILVSTYTRFDRHTMVLL